MNELFSSSYLSGVCLTLCIYLLSSAIQKKVKHPILNPILISILVIITILKASGISYASYMQSTILLSTLLTPSTLCFAVLLYEQYSLIKRYAKAIILGVFAGTLSCMLTIFLLCKLFDLDHTIYVTLLPKSITTAIGMTLSQMMNGYVPITIILIIITGIFGNMIGPGLCRLAGISNPIAQGAAIGTASHAIGTAKAMEINQIAGAVSSFSIILAGIFTVLLSPVFSLLI